MIEVLASGWILGLEINLYVFNTLCYVCVEKNCFVQNVAAAQWVVRFRIRLQGLVREQWYDLAATPNTISLINDKKT
jgi:hypothetical protein